MGANAQMIQAIKSDPRFHRLVARRRRFAWTLTAAVIVIYFGFIGLVAFAPRLLGAPLSGVITVGIPVGLAVIVSAFLLTALYVHRANSEFDALTREIADQVK
jgi:uncharacterized membrane protein (DUF485 family)